ncbi:uncharacterized protein LOC134701082 [Mytilus trossulus]|uniref:uncharacterized protein LOC134701082 n=1 Tax=Mytilus trossulus TaxID=6551 RepID=UPI003003ED69
MLHNLNILFVIFQYVLSDLINGFLIDSSTTTNYPSVITDKHYIAVIGLLMEERQSRHMLEQVVNSLQQKLQSLEQKHISKHIEDISALQLKVNTLNASCSLCQNNLGDLKSKFNDLEMNYTLLKDENQKLSQDVAILRQTQSVGNIGTLKQQVQATTNRVKQLEYNNTVTHQDIIALSKRTNQNEMDITTCTSVGQNLTKQITSIKQEFLKKTQNDTAIKRLTEDLDLRIASLEINMTFLNTQLASFTHNNQPVAFTAWNEGGNVTSDKVIKFNKIKTSIGVSNLPAIHSTGTFTVEIDGVYIIAVTVNSDTNDSAFEIYKNNTPLSRVYIQGKVGHNDQSGTSVVSIDLQNGDTVSVGSRETLHVEMGWSTLSIIKI